MAIEIEFYELLPGAQTVRVAAREATFVPGQDFTETRIDIKAGQTSADSPFGAPPVLKDSNDPGGHPITLFGATGVASYLNELAKLQQKPVFIPPTPCNLPLSYQWTELATSTAFPLIETITRHGRSLSTPQQRKAAFGLAVQGMKDLMTTLENKVFTGQKFLVSHDGQNPFSLADIALASALTYVRILPAARRIELDDFPKTKVYLEGIESRPAFRAVFEGVTLPKSPQEPPPPLEEPPQ
jgi:glutathione S-transferase